MESEESETDFVAGSNSNVPSLPNSDIDPEKKEKKSGVVYIQTVPPHFTVLKMRGVLSQYAEIGRIYFQVYFL